MRKIRLNLTKSDDAVLRCFFTNRTFKVDESYLSLEVRWKSTTEISKELREGGQRTKKRLEKLHSFGFLELEEDYNKNRTDHYWFIRKEGFYYIFSLLERNEMRGFLRSNMDKFLGFGELEKMVMNNNVQLRYFVSQMNSIIKNHHYYLIKYFISKWLEDNAFIASTMQMPYPNIKKIRNKKK
ncbi:MAG: hypothetical protein WD717_06740 [Nitrosarchaeum sp.]